MYSVDDSANENFNRPFSDYKAGFKTSDERTFWFGLDSIYTLTNQAAYSLLVEFKHMGVWKHALYDDFRILSEEYGYQLFVSGYDASNSDIPDELSSHNYINFVAPGSSGAEGICAGYYASGWWFKTVDGSGSCSRASNLMGFTESNTTSHKGKVWGSFTNITKVWMAVMRKGLFVSKAIDVQSSILFCRYP